MLRKLVASITLCSVVILAGCSGSVTAGSSTAINTTTGQVTETVTGSVTINFGGAKPHIIGTSDGGTGVTLSQEVPGSFYPDYSVSPQLTLSAQTDTGYQTSIVVSLQATTPTNSATNASDTVYAWTVPDTSALDAWQQDVLDHSNASATITGSNGMVYITGGATGGYTIASTVDVTGLSASVSTSSSFFVPPTGGDECETDGICRLPPTR